MKGRANGSYWSALAVHPLVIFEIGQNERAVCRPRLGLQASTVITTLIFYFKFHLLE
jgi:hypothetical protein